MTLNTRETDNNTSNTNNNTNNTDHQAYNEQSFSPKQVVLLCHHYN